MTVYREPSTTLYCLSACSSPQVLVIRRGPSKVWHFLLWNRDTQEIEHGSWFRGMIYPHKCDISPKGEWMTILAYRGTNDPIAWTALCKPPQVKAYAFWPQPSARYGGGFFDERMPVAWMNMPDPKDQVEERSAHDYEFGYQESPDDYFGSLDERLKRDCWKLDKGLSSKEMKFVWSKKSPDKKFKLILRLSTENTSRDGTNTSESWQPRIVDYSVFCEESGVETPLEEASWANWNKESFVCFAKGGSLMTAVPSNLKGSESLVIDLTQLQPPSNGSRNQKPSNHIQAPTG